MLCSHINVSNTHFKAIILVSLPSSWHTYVEPYNGNANNPYDSDPKRCLPSDAFSGLLQEEYRIQMIRSNNGANKNSTNGSMNLVKTQNATSTSKSLAETKNPPYGHFVIIANTLDTGQASATNLMATNAIIVVRLGISKRIARVRRKGRKRRWKRKVQSRWIMEKKR